MDILTEPQYDMQAVHACFIRDNHITNLNPAFEILPSVKDGYFLEEAFKQREAFRRELKRVEDTINKMQFIPDASLSLSGNWDYADTGNMRIRPLNLG